MDDTYYLLVVFAIGLYAFLFRYIGSLSKDKRSRMYYIASFCVVTIGLVGYYLYLSI